MSKNREKIAVSEIAKLLTYDPETGVLLWRARDESRFANVRAAHIWNTRFSGKAAGRISLGYRRIVIDYKDYPAHWLAWAMTYGRWPDQIDHINGNPADNRLVNLREVDQTDNMRNRMLSCKSVSGRIGVTWSRTEKKWLAQIRVAEHTIRLGSFDDIVHAAVARKAAEIVLGFHPNHGRTA